MVKRGADHAIGRFRGRLTTKINAVVNGVGLLIAHSVAPSQASDKAAVPELIAYLAPGRDLVADQGYDAIAVIDLITARGRRAHILIQRDRKVQRSVAKALSRERNRIERLFSRMKNFRRIAIRFDKPARNYFAALHLAAAQL